MKKKLFSLMMAALMIFMSLPTFVVPAQAATTVDGLPYSISNGKVTITTGYTGNATELEIPATIEGCPVTRIGAYAFYECKTLKSVTLPEGITKIGDSAFAHCSSLTSMTFPDSLTTIDVAAFYNCTKLKSVTISGNLKTIVDGAFSNCERLTTIYYNGTEAQWKEVYIGAANDYLTRAEIVFEGASNEPVAPDGLEYVVLDSKVVVVGYTGDASELDIPDTINGYPVTAVDVRAFYECHSLASVSIPNSVTSIGERAFYGCSNLESISLPDGITNISKEAFRNCSKLTEVTIPNSVEKIENYAFADCKNLKSITLSNGLTDIGVGAFKGTAIETITIPDGVTTIGAYAFYDCSNLASITIPDGVTTIGDYAFCGCLNLTSIKIPDGVSTINANAFLDCTSLTSVTIPVSVTSICWRAFKVCDFLTDVYYGGTEDQWNAITIETENDDLIYSRKFFSGSENPVYPSGPDIFEGFKYSVSNGEATITEYIGRESEVVTPAYIEGYPVTEISSYVFSYNQRLKSVEISQGVKRIGLSVLEGCKNLETVILPEGIEFIGGGLAGGTAFWDDPENWTDGALYVGEYLLYVEKSSLGEEFTVREGTKVVASYAFQLCEELKKINLPEGLVTIGYYAFSYCEALESIDVPSTVKYVEYGAFSGCTSLKNVELPEGLDLLGAFAFHGCTSITKITLPDGIGKIEPELFMMCTALEEVTIHANIGEFGRDPFFNCSSLSVINFVGTNKQWYALNVSGINNNVTVNFMYTDMIDGDINNDGLVNAKDSNLFKQILAGMIDVEARSAEFFAIDLQSDGILNAKDSNLLKSILAGNTKTSYKLFVDGKEVKGNFFIYKRSDNKPYPFMEVPILTVLKALGAKVEWTSDTTADIYFNGDVFEFDGETHSIVAKGSDLNLIIPLPGGYIFPSEYRFTGTDLIIDNFAAESVSFYMGHRVAIITDDDNHTVNVITVTY